MSSARNRTFERMGNRVAALDDAMHVAERLQQSRAFESNFHGGSPIGLLFDPSRPPLGCAGDGGGLWRGFRQIASRRD